MAAYTVRKGKWYIASRATIFINDLAALIELGQL